MTGCHVWASIDRRFPSEKLAFTRSSNSPSLEHGSGDLRVATPYRSLKMEGRCGLIEDLALHGITNLLCHSVGSIAAGAIYRNDSFIVGSECQHDGGTFFLLHFGAIFVYLAKQGLFPVCTGQLSGNIIVRKTTHQAQSLTQSLTQSTGARVTAQ